MFIIIFFFYEKLYKFEKNNTHIPTCKSKFPLVKMTVFYAGRVRQAEKQLAQKTVT